MVSSDSPQGYYYKSVYQEHFAPTVGLGKKFPGQIKHHLHLNYMIFGSSSNRSEPHTPPDMAQLLTIVEILRQQNESLQESVHTLQQNTREEEAEEELMDL